ncbi:MAG: EfeM/EfeO family lipoprotein [Snodgrassella sp.]|uniref:EfeM/EfeO family lipoprotein n=1 Tax=Snodgrassella sp. TaxID=2815304 RepID=UPI0025873374|nr:EfeM/EfeO family lipoprotein [Snodgrassella sp.]MCO6513146.1 EfeM/EfeO family lipoprotein [Snodgrassella sp.]
MKQHRFYALFLCSLLLPAISAAHGLRAPIIDDTNAVTAKGDIPTPAKYHSAIRAYQQQVVRQLKTTQQYLNAIVHASQSGQLLQAQQNYVRAHQSYEQVRVIVKLFGNADQNINSRADYYLQGINNPSFSGFHRLEYELFVRKDLQQAQAETSNLQHGIIDLQKRVASDELDIAKVIQAASDFLEMILQTKLAGKENQYSHSDLADIQANVTGSAQIVQQLADFIPAEQRAALDSGYQQIFAVLQRYQLPQNQFQSFSQLSQTDHDSLYSLLSIQTSLLAQLRAQLGVRVYYKYPH